MGLVPLFILWSLSMTSLLGWWRSTERVDELRDAIKKLPACGDGPNDCNTARKAARMVAGLGD